MSRDSEIDFTLLSMGVEVGQQATENGTNTRAARFITVVDAPPLLPAQETAQRARMIFSGGLTLDMPAPKDSIDEIDENAPFSLSPQRDFYPEDLADPDSVGFFIRTEGSPDLLRIDNNTKAPPPTLASATLAKALPPNAATPINDSQPPSEDSEPTRVMVAVPARRRFSTREAFFYATAAIISGAIAVGTFAAISQKESQTVHKNTTTSPDETPPTPSFQSTVSGVSSGTPATIATALPSATPSSSAHTLLKE